MNLFWFRDDLRITDNTGLWYARQGGPVIALYVITPEQWRAHDMAPIRADFVLRNLRELSAALAERNIPLLVRQADDFAASEAEVLQVCEQHHVSHVFCNRQYAVNEAQRDKRMHRKLLDADIQFTAYHDFLILPPGEVLKDDGEPYKVFTPYKRAWLKTFSAQGGVAISAPPDAQEALDVEPDPIPEVVDGFEFEGERELWPAGENAALGRLGAFIKNDLIYYERDRDLPADSGTSRLSPYLAAGVISARQCFNAAMNANRGETDSGSKGAVTWMSELIWREFYQSLLHFHPELCRYKPFKPETDQIRWRDSEADFQAWCEGRTGVPIVDAAMHELLETGWMHNRCRMIVAMFLTKNLLIDWRKGERFFMQQLIDGDLAQNNGGWQWSASTGTDAAPYFRIFNPFSQAERFDPDAEYIKRYVPELRDLAPNDIHKPERLARNRPVKYPKLMVDLKASRQRAIEVFKGLG